MHIFCHITHVTFIDERSGWSGNMQARLKPYKVKLWTEEGRIYISWWNNICGEQNPESSKGKSGAVRYPHHTLYSITHCFVIIFQFDGTDTSMFECLICSSITVIPQHLTILLPVILCPDHAVSLVSSVRGFCQGSCTISVHNNP